MPDELFKAVDDYVVSRLHEPDPVLQQVLAEARSAELPEIQVSAAQGKFLHLLARAMGARRVLELGTLGAYSTIWLARALPPDGHLVTLELSSRHAEVARKNLEAAGLADRVELRLGPAIESLAALEEERAAPFDLVFIDADKPLAAQYFEAALSLCRAGSVIVVDNVIRQGRVVEEQSEDANVKGVRQLFELLHGDTRVAATALQTVGQKGHDGFVLAVVT
jgi:predicted O-methyltransferase YrrM